VGLGRTRHLVSRTDRHRRCRHPPEGEDRQPHELADVLIDSALEAYARRETELGAENCASSSGRSCCAVIDTRWMEHLLEMDYLKDGIGLRAMGQRDPLVEYKSEAYNMFGELVAAINEDFLRTVFHIQVMRPEEPPAEPLPSGVTYSAPSESTIFSGAAQAAATAAGPAGPSPEAIAAASAAAGGSAKAATMVKDKDDPFADVGRNDPCPCGSGKKYKKCHGAAV
jgi:preprotein translocase subunit SecA